ncbi:uncharacterized protein LOC144388896 isoform X2 [Gasterosteus aculeatus]
MYRRNNQRIGAGASLLGTPPTGYNVNIALSHARNEVHCLKRQVSELTAHTETVKFELTNMLKGKDLAYEQMVDKNRKRFSDLIRENEGLSLKVTETTKQLSVKSAELTVNNQTWKQKYEDLEKKTTKKLDDQQQSLESKVTGLLSTNISLQEKLHKQQANNQQLEAEHKLLKIKTEALDETIRENEGLSLKLTETTKELSVKSAELTVNNQTWQQKYEDLEKKTTKKLDDQQQSLESKVTGLLSTNISLQEKLHKQQANNQQLEAEHKLLKIKTEALDETIRENEGLSLKLTETTKELSVKSAELTVNNQTWQQKYEDLEKKTTKKLDDQQQSLESKVTGLLSTNISLQEKLHKQQANNQQLEAEHKLLKIKTEALDDTIRENEGLSLKLTETTKELSVKSAELTVNNQTWQQKYEDLEKKTTKKLDDQQQSLESKVTGLLSTNISLQEKLHKQQANNQQLEAEHKLLKIKTEALDETIRENEGLSLKLTETTKELSVKSAELTVNNQTWQQKYEDLEKKTTKKLDDQQQSLESKVTGLLSTNISLQEKLHKQQANNQQLEAEHKLLKIKTEALDETIRENKGLSLKLTETTKELSVKSAELTVNNETWQQLEAEHKLLKTQRDSLAALIKSQEETHHEMVTISDFTELCLISRIQQLEDTISKEHQILITRIQELEDDKTVLENICLDLKKKKRGIFGRRMQDRQTEMDKMRRKMQDKETKK